MNKYQEALNHLIKCDRDSCSNISDAYRNDISSLQELIRKSQYMPNDEKFIEWLRKIKKICNCNPDCCNCPFSVKDVHCQSTILNCQITMLTNELEDLPEDWNMEEIERIIRL